MRRFFELAFTPSVQDIQSLEGSRNGYARLAPGQDGRPDVLTQRETGFIAQRDSFYLASVSQTGWPYVQHRGGPPGFVRLLGERLIGWPEFSGNRQYVSLGNTFVDDRVAMIFMDYAHQQRLKILGHLRAHEPASRPDLERLFAADEPVKRFMEVRVEAFDWNCPQHITPRFTTAEIERAVAPLHARIAELEAQAAAQA